MPVNAGCGGRRPGQILDQSASVLSAAARDNDCLCWLALDGVDEQSRKPRRIRRSLGRRGKGARSRAETEAERRQQWERTQAEIDEIVSDFHAMLPRAKAKAIGAIYARYSTRFQDSIADQVRSLFEVAIKEGIFVPRENVFVDLAVKGYHDRRPGLNSLRAALANKQLQVLLVFTTNRLFRKNYMALRFVEEEVVERGVRCLFTKNRIDTADGDRWRLPLQLHAAIDEAGTGMYAPPIKVYSCDVPSTGLCPSAMGENRCLGNSPNEGFLDVRLSSTPIFRHG